MTSGQGGKQRGASSPPARRLGAAGQPGSGPRDRTAELSTWRSCNGVPGCLCHELLLDIPCRTRQAISLLQGNCWHNFTAGNHGFGHEETVYDTARLFLESDWYV